MIVFIFVMFCFISFLFCQAKIVLSIPDISNTFLIAWFPMLYMDTWKSAFKYREISSGILNDVIW